MMEISLNKHLSEQRFTASHEWNLEVNCTRNGATVILMTSSTSRRSFGRHRGKIESSKPGVAFQASGRSRNRCTPRDLLLRGLPPGNTSHAFEASSRKLCTQMQLHHKFLIEAQL